MEWENIEFLRGAKYGITMANTLTVSQRMTLCEQIDGKLEEIGDGWSEEIMGDNLPHLAHDLGRR